MEAPAVAVPEVTFVDVLESSETPEFGGGRVSAHGLLTAGFDIRFLQQKQAESPEYCLFKPKKNPGGGW